MKKFSPMLGVEAPDLTSLRYPLLASEKFDGIRCLVVEIEWAKENINFQPKHKEYLTSARFAIGLTRSGKPVPNRFVQKQLDNIDLIGLDGELLTSRRFNETSSAIMSHGGDPTFEFHVFDFFDRPNDKFTDRQVILNNKTLPCLRQDCAVRRVPHELVTSHNIAAERYNELIFAGAEGLILRDPNAPYKYGRSTVRQQGLLKLKPLREFEAVVVGFEQGYVNENEPELNELGYTKRSSLKENKVSDEIIGAFICEAAGQNFRVGIFKGFTKYELRQFWRLRHTLVGRIAKLQSMDHGELDKPRHCRFVGFRDASDL